MFMVQCWWLLMCSGNKQTQHRQNLKWENQKDKYLLQFILLENVFPWQKTQQIILWVNDLVALIQKMGFWDICSWWRMPGLLHKVLANVIAVCLPVEERRHRFQMALELTLKAWTKPGWFLNTVLITVMLTAEARLTIFLTLIKIPTVREQMAKPINLL